MTRFPPVSRPSAAVGAIVFAAALSGCGLTGDLQRPEPLIGNPEGSGTSGLPDRGIERGLPETLANDVPEDEEADALPNAEDELLGGPSGG
ncbi:MAG: lipoprotein [Pseudomonadota bacterium]